MNSNFFHMKPSQVKKAVETCIKARLVPFIQSSPGMGKSSIVKQIAEEYGLKVVDCRLSSMEPTDLQGLPWIQNGKAQFNPYDFFPIETKKVPEGYSGWLLFLDEFNSASRATQAAAYRVVLDREIGQHKLHDQCVVVAAGNLITDNAIVNKLSTAMSSRVIHLNMDPSFEDWRDDFALPNKIDERVIAYLSMFPEKLMSFNPDCEDQTFASPRTWEFVSRLIKASHAEVTSELTPLLAGAITAEQASAFVQFCQVYKDLITVDQIIANEDIEPPADTATRWAELTHLVTKTTAENFKHLLKFINKMPVTFKIVYMRAVQAADPMIITLPEFNEWVTEVGNYCYGD